MVQDKRDISIVSNCLISTFSIIQLKNPGNLSIINDNIYFNKSFDVLSVLVCKKTEIIFISQIAK